MRARATRNLIVVATVLVGIAISIRISVPEQLAAAPARPSTGQEENSSGSAGTPRPEKAFGASPRMSGVPRDHAAPFPPSALPAVPNGDFEIAVTDSELQAIVDARYGPFFRLLNSSAGTSRRLRELLIERQHAAIDVANAAMVAGLNPIRDLALIRRAITLAEQDVDADVGRELGPSVLNALHEFEQGRAEHNTVDDLTRALADSGDPLRPAQQQHLLRILQGAPAAGVAIDINGAIYGRYDRRAQVSATAIAAATPELSPRQLDALRQLARAPSPDQTAGN